LLLGTEALGGARARSQEAGGVAGRREGGPQPKGRQPQRCLGHPAGRRSLGKILTSCRIS
jgi:hypothetical protein